MNIFDQIRLVRKTLGLNRMEFARRVGLTQTYLSMIELEKSILAEKNIRLICATFAILVKKIVSCSIETKNC